MLKIELYNKARAVIDSCTSVEQMFVAIKYTRLAAKTAGTSWEDIFKALLVTADTKLHKLKVQDNLKELKWHL